MSLFYIPKIHNQATPDSQTGTGTHRQRTRAHRATTGTDTGSHTPLTAQTTNPPTTTQPSAVCYLPTYEPPSLFYPYSTVDSFELYLVGRAPHRSTARFCSRH